MRQVTYKKLFKFIQMEKDYLPEYHKRRIIELQKVYYLGWLKEFLRFMGMGEFKDITKANIEILKKYLNDAKPEIKMSGEGNKIKITINP